MIYLSLSFVRNVTIIPLCVNQMNIAAWIVSMLGIVFRTLCWMGVINCQQDRHGIVLGDMIRLGALLMCRDWD